MMNGSKEMKMMRCSVTDFRRRDFLRSAAGISALLALTAAPRTGVAQTGGAAPLKIATVGAGHIGGTLGSLWVKAGHPVMFSSRHPEELKDMVAGLGPLASAGTTGDAIAFADVVFLAVPYSAIKQIGQDYGKALATKVLVLDASNPIVARDGDVATWARDKGAGLATEELIPGAHLVRAFNAVGYMKVREDAADPSKKIGMPIAGDDTHALAIASTLVREAGFQPVVIGPLAMGKYLIPGTPLAGEHTPEEIQQIVASLK
jgi:predicted dinucleotide-binding enzyme